MVCFRRQRVKGRSLHWFSHLDGDERVDMKAGDVCVQRGTIHGWVNYSDKPARLYFVLSGTYVLPVKLVTC